MNQLAINLGTNIVEMHKASCKQNLSHQRLQRLVFLFQLHYLKEYNKHFLNEEFVAFKLGGVIKELYSNYKIFGDYISEPAKSISFSEGRFVYIPYPPITLTDEQYQFLFDFLHMYDDLDEWQLADICITLMKEEGIEMGSGTVISKRQMVNMSSHIHRLNL